MLLKWTIISLVSQPALFGAQLALGIELNRSVRAEGPPFSSFKVQRRNMKAPFDSWTAGQRSLMLFCPSNYHLFCWNLAQMEGWEIQNQKIKLINRLCCLVQTFVLIGNQNLFFLNLLPGWLPRLLLLLHKLRGFVRRCNTQASASLIGFFWRRGTKWLVSHRGRQRMGETFNRVFQSASAGGGNSEFWNLNIRKIKKKKGLYYTKFTSWSAAVTSVSSYPRVQARPTHTHQPLCNRLSKGWREISHRGKTRLHNRKLKFKWVVHLFSAAGSASGFWDEPLTCGRSIRSLNKKGIRPLAGRQWR